MSHSGFQGIKEVAEWAQQEADRAEAGGISTGAIYEYMYIQITDVYSIITFVWHIRNAKPTTHNIKSTANSSKS